MSCLPSFALAATVLLSGFVSAQCEFMVHPFTLVNADGQPLPTHTTFGEPYSIANGKFYMALAPTTPSGIYVYQVTDVSITELLSRELLVDRTILVRNEGGVIHLTRISANPALPAFGRGLLGLGDSIPMTRFNDPTSAGTACRFKVFLGDNYVNQNNDPLGWVYGIRGGINPTTNACSVLSYAKFTTGEGGSASVQGAVFLDLDTDGIRDVGEPGTAGRQVRLLGHSVDRTATTDSEGHYMFADVPAGDYTVELLGVVATTAQSYPVVVCPCSPRSVQDFGVPPPVLQCNARTPGFWANPGLRVIHNMDLLSDLIALQVVDARGNRFFTNSPDVYRKWLLSANATNMAYMLSAHTVAMHFNLRAGFVHPDCVVDDPQLGLVRIQDLMIQAVASLALDPHTPSMHPNRAYQERLKNALQRANENRTWL